MALCVWDKVVTAWLTTNAVISTVKQAESSAKAAELTAEAASSAVQLTAMLCDFPPPLYA